MGSAHVKVNIVTRRVRLDPDGTRRVIKPPPPRSVRLAAAVLMLLIGLAQMSYGIWAGLSDRTAAALYRSSESCRLVNDGATASIARSNCRVEDVIVYDRHARTSRGHTNYYLLTVSPTGRRDVTMLVGPGSKEFWKRVRPTEGVKLQRFIAPGYHITDEPTAVADSTGWVLTRYHPDSPTHFDALNILLGGAMTMLALVLGVQLFKASRPRAATL